MNVLYTVRTVGQLSAGTRIEIGEMDADTGMCQGFIWMADPKSKSKRPIMKEVVVHRDDLILRRKDRPPREKRN